METDSCTIPYEHDERQPFNSESDVAVKEDYLYCNISIPLEGQIDVAMPCEVVTETVVSTTPPNKSARRRKRKVKKGITDPNADIIQDDVFDCADVSVAMESNSESQKFSLCDVLRHLSGESHLLPPSKAEREATKRMRDCLKKRELRQNPDYRKRESEKAQQRMANKRQHNPDYRENERRRDKERRAMARTDEEMRKRERERDRISKKTQRDMYKNNMVPVTKCDYLTVYSFTNGSEPTTVSGASVCQTSPSHVDEHAAASSAIESPQIGGCHSVIIDKEFRSQSDIQCSKQGTVTNDAGSYITNVLDQYGDVNVL